MSDELLYFNGINGATGGYEMRPMTLAKLSKVAQGQSVDELDRLELRQKRDLILEHKGDPSQQKWAIKEGHDPKDLAQAGWGVIFAAADEKETAALREALQPLLDRRQTQAAQVKDYYYKEFIGPNRGVKQGEDKRSFLSRHGMGTAGAVDPEKAPYYLLIAGSPDAIPYRFQYQLDVQYAVGRAHFETLEEYRQYAENVVRLESQAPFLAPSTAFFGAANPDDRATRLSAEKLVKPLSESVIKDQPDWAVTALPPEKSTKTQMATLLSGGADMPALLFAASHGMGFPNGDPRQLKHQGALLCQDWPGPKTWKGPIPEGHYFSADDIASTANLAGLTAFFFACYGCGTPQYDDFSHLEGGRNQIAPHAFLANLPRRMLLRGALAVVGHVERAWGTSFMWGNATPQLVAFESALKRLMEDHPVGSAMEYFNGRYAEISSDLTSYIDQYQWTGLDDEKVADLWTANNDARSYVVIGDPAVRMPVRLAGAAAAERPGPVPVILSAPKAAKAAAPAAQTNVEAIANHLAQALKQALNTAPGLQNVSGVNVEVKDINEDQVKGDFTGTVKVKAKARRGDSACEIVVDCKVTGQALK